MLLSAVNLYNGKIELLSIEVKLFRWTITSPRRAEYNLTTDVIAITFYITKTLIDKSQFKEQFTNIFMLVKTSDDCRFDFSVTSVVVCSVAFCHEELSRTVTDVGVDWLKYMTRPADSPIDLKFAVAEIYVSLCLLTKSAVAIDVLGNKSNNIKRISFPLEISRNPNQFNTMFS